MYYCLLFTEFLDNISGVCIFVDTGCAANIWGIPGWEYCGSPKKDESNWTPKIPCLAICGEVKKREGKRSEVCSSFFLSFISSHAILLQFSAALTLNAILTKSIFHVCTWPVYWRLTWYNNGPAFLSPPISQTVSTHLFYISKLWYGCCFFFKSDPIAAQLLPPLWPQVVPWVCLRRLSWTLRKWQLLEKLEMRKAHHWMTLTRKLKFIRLV